MVLHNQAGKHRWAFNHLFLEFEQRLNVLYLIGRQVLARVFLVSHQLSKASNRVVEKANAIIGDASDAFIEIPD